MSGGDGCVHVCPLECILLFSVSYRYFHGTELRKSDAILFDDVPSQFLDPKTPLLVRQIFSDVIA
jgi:hypothetical protein